MGSGEMKREEIPPELNMPPQVLHAYQIYMETHNVTKTAKAVGKSRRTIYDWKEKYKWDELEKRRLARIIRNTEEYRETVKDEARKILKEATDLAVAKLKMGELEIRTVRDLIDLLKFRLELEGERFDETKVEINNAINIASLMEEIEKRRKEAEGGASGE